MMSSPHQFHSGDHIKKDEVDGACSTDWGKKRCIRLFGGET
jgi:hypothetical protein